MFVMAGDQVEVSVLEGVLYLGHSEDLGTLHDEGADKAGRYLVGIHGRNDETIGADDDVAYAIEGSYEDGKVVHGGAFAFIWAGRIAVLVVTAEQGVTNANLYVPTVKGALQVAWGADPDEGPLDDGYAVTEGLGLEEIMGAEDDGAALALEGADKVAHHLCTFGV